MTSVILVLLYPIVVFARALNAVLGRDPLRLRPTDDKTYWIVRGAQPPDTSCFSEASSVEGLGHGGMGGVATGLFSWVARFYAPGRAQPREKFSPAADREQGIPDEMYTLW